MAFYGEKKKIPNIFRYGILLEAAYQAFLVLPMFLDSNSQGTRMQNATFTFMMIFMVSAALNIGEFMLFRFNTRSVKIIILGTEFIRGSLFWLRFPALNVELGGSTSLNTLFSLVSTLSLGIALGGTISILFYEKINSVASTPRMRAMMNLLPAIVILLLFMGTGFLESIGFGATRQANPDSLPPYTGGAIDYTAFNDPTWDSSYFLENLLDQFTAGLSLPDEPVFNVTNTLGDATEPPTYWRLTAWDKYLYKPVGSMTSDWDITAGTPIDIDSVNAFSQPITGTKDARFQVDILVNRSNDVYENYIPTTWNGEFGAYIDKNTFSTSALGIPTTVYEMTPPGLTDNSGVKVQINYGSTVEDEEVVVSYICDYVQPDLLTIGAASLGRDQYLPVLNAINPAEAETIWNTIKSLYLQIPEGNQLPFGFPTYADWAPNVCGNATLYNSSSLSVMQQALADGQQLAPDAELGLSFSEEMWVSNAFNSDMDHPEINQDFNEWFIDINREGVAIHFASLLTTWLRLQKIPARMVQGYAAGNETLGGNTKRVITNRWQHVWTEALVPYLYNDGGIISQGLQWVPVDPIGASLYGDSLPTDVGSAEETFYIFNPQTLDLEHLDTTFPSSVHRVGTIRNDETPYTQEVQELYSNHPNTAIPEGIATVSVLISSCKYNPATGFPTTLPTPLSGVPVRFSLMQDNGSGVTKIPLNTNINSLNLTTDVSGIASFLFNYSIIPHGTGEFRFKAEVFNASNVDQIFRQAWSDSNPLPSIPDNLNDYSPISFIVGDPPLPVIPLSKEQDLTTRIVFNDNFIIEKLISERDFIIKNDLTSEKEDIESFNDISKNILVIITKLFN